MSGMKRRLDRVEQKLSPTRYAVIEDLIRKLEMEKKETLTQAEQKLLDELRELPIHPTLMQKMKALEKQDQ